MKSNIVFIIGGKYSSPEYIFLGGTFFLLGALRSEASKIFKEDSVGESNMVETQQ